MNDKERPAPMVEKLKALPKQLGRTRRILADSDYASEKNVEGCAVAGIEPLIALKHERHHRTWRQRFAAAPKALPDSETAMEKMRWRLKTPAGRKLCALRKQTYEPVFGIIKSVMGFRQFRLRGLENARGEWSLVTMSSNLKRMFACSSHDGAEWCRLSRLYLQIRMKHSTSPRNIPSMKILSPTAAGDPIAVDL